MKTKMERWRVSQYDNFGPSGTEDTRTLLGAVALWAIRGGIFGRSVFSCRIDRITPYL